MKYLYNGTKIIASSRGEAITKIVASEQFRNINFPFRLACYDSGFLKKVFLVKSLQEAISLYKKIAKEDVRVSNIMKFGEDKEYPINYVIEKRKPLSSEEVVKLRDEINLGSLYAGDYKNSFGVDMQNCLELFDGYDSYLQEEGNKEDSNELMNYYDNIEPIYAYVNFKTNKVAYPEK